MNASPARKVRVVQCWDDGVDDDVRLTEILRRHGARASFNLNPAQHGPQRTSGWKYRDIKPVAKLARPELRAVYDGFTIANHTASHPFLTRLTPEEAEREIREGRDALEQIFGQPVRGFAYPFGDFNPSICDMVRAAGHVYGRTTSRTDTVLPCEDPMVFHPSCHFRDEDFWSRFEHAKLQGGVFYFWGHSYELMTEEDWRAFEENIRRLSQDEAVCWTDLPALFS